MRRLNRHSFRTSRILFFIFLCTLANYYYYFHLQTQLLQSSQPTIRIMYVVRTISKYYSTRLIYLLQTWIPLVQEHVFFVSDTFLPNISQTHIISTEKICGPSSHSVKSLCCQTVHDFILFRRHAFHYDWFCHFDDDQYIHVDNLHKYLSTLDTNYPYYIGRNSWNKTFKRHKDPHPYDFWFATLGAGVCFSKRMLQLLEPYTQTVPQFVGGCVREFYPDDIYIGFLINNYLNVSLTKNFRFHSHLERSLFTDKKLLIDSFNQQITFGFRLPQIFSQSFPLLFSRTIDPFRMRTVHCLLYSHLKECRIRIQSYLLKTNE